MKKHNKPSNGKTSKDLLKQVQALGGQFEDARSMNIPSGCTFKSLKEDKVIKFLSDWIFEEDNLTIKETKEQEVIYLPNLVEDSSGKAYNNLEQFLTTLPKIDGLKWIIPTSSQVCYVLGKHYKEHKEYLLKDYWTWTTDTYKYSGGLGRLLVGLFRGSGIGVSYHDPDGWLDNVGLFVLGVPSEIGELDSLESCDLDIDIGDNKQNELRNLLDKVYRKGYDKCIEDIKEFLEKHE